MLNTALSAILVTIASPLQVAVAMVLSVPAGIWAKQKLNTGKEYPYLELSEAQKRLEFCREVYGAGHQQTDLAIDSIESILAKYYKAKVLDLEDLQMYLDLGICSGSLFNRLTAPA